jgi:hypothetical protein
MSDPDPLEALEAMAAQGVHPFEDGQPLPVEPPHVVLLRAIEGHRVTLAAVVRWLEREHGLPLLDVLEDLRREIRAEAAVDAQIGLIADLVAEGAIEPWPEAALRRADAAFPCGCTHAPREESPP